MTMGGASGGNINMNFFPLYGHVWATSEEGNRLDRI